MVTRCVFSQLLNSAWQYSMTSKILLLVFTQQVCTLLTDMPLHSQVKQRRWGKSLHIRPGCHSFLFTTPKKSATSSTQLNERGIYPKCHTEDPLLSSEEDSNTPLRTNPALGKFLHYPSAALLKKHVKPEVCTATVLTSLENLKLLEEKQRAKEEKQKAKEEKQKAREEKQGAKQREKEEKKIAAEKCQTSKEADKSKSAK